MNSKRHILEAALLLAAVLPFLSWALSALGVPCRSLLDGEGLRWLFRHAADCLRSRLDACALCFVLMQGVMRKSRLLPLGHTFRQRRFRRFAAVYGVVLVSILAVSLLPGSPLLSITGGIVGSPLMQGLPFLGWLSFMVFCLCYGFRRGERWTDMLTFGFQRYPLLLPLAVVVSFCYQCVEYIVHYGQI